MIRTTAFLGSILAAMLLGAGCAALFGGGGTPIENNNGNGNDNADVDDMDSDNDGIPDIDDPIDDDLIGNDNDDGNANDNDDNVNDNGDNANNNGNTNDNTNEGDFDGDGIPDEFEDENVNGVPDILEDSDGDGINDAVDSNDNDGGDDGDGQGSNNYRCQISCRLTDGSTYGGGSVSHSANSQDLANDMCASDIDSMDADEVCAFGGNPSSCNCVEE